MPLISGSPIFDRAALEVGHITFEWARIESLIGKFNSHLLGINAASTEAKILDGNMDTRQRIHAAKGLGDSVIRSAM